MDLFAKHHEAFLFVEFSFVSLSSSISLSLYSEYQMSTLQSYDFSAAWILILFFLRLIFGDDSLPEVQIEANFPVF